MPDDTLPEREVKDFKFQQLCKIRIQPSPLELPKDRAQLLAVSSKYGLTFLCHSTGINVLKTSSISDLDIANASERSSLYIEDYPVEHHVPFSGIPSYLALSCDELTLCLVLSEKGQTYAAMYDVRAFADKSRTPRSFNRLRLPCPVSDLSWNPTMPSLLVVCLNNGEVNLLDATDKIQVKASLPAATGGTCVCWSPKGKQMVIGKADGTLSQYDPTLTEKKKIACPIILQGKHKVLDVMWLSTYMFVAAFTGHPAEEGDQPIVIMMNVPKDAQPTYINFEDFCYSSCEERQKKYYMHLIQKWEMIVLVSSNGCEACILAKNLDNKMSWERWVLEDSGRAELPVTEDTAESYPLGVAVDFSSQVHIPTGENRTHQPCPLLLMFSSDMVLVPFYMMYSHKDAVSLTTAPETLSPSGARAAITSPETDAVPSGARPVNLFGGAHVPQPAFEGKAIDVAPVPIPVFGGKGIDVAPVPRPIFGDKGIDVTPVPRPSFGVPTSTTGFSFQPQMPTTGLTKPNAGFMFGATGVVSNTASSGDTVQTQVQPSVVSSGSSKSISPQPTASIFNIASGTKASSFGGGAVLGGGISVTTAISKPSSLFGQVSQSTAPSSLPSTRPSAVLSTAPASFAAAALSTSNVGPTAGFHTSLSGTTQSSSFTKIQTSNSIAGSSLTHGKTTGGIVPGHPGSLTSGQASAFSKGTGDATTIISSVNLAAKQSTKTGIPALAAPLGSGSSGSKPTTTSPVIMQGSQVRLAPKSPVKPSVIKTVSQNKEDPVPTAIMTAVDSSFTNSILEEISDFEKELYDFKELVARMNITVGTPEEMRTLRIRTEEITGFNKDIKETTKSQHAEIEDLKTMCLDLFSMAEECVVRNNRNNDPRYHHLLQSRALDPASAEKMRHLRAQYQFMDAGLREMDLILDHQWEEYQNKKQTQRIRAPTSDAIYRTVKSNHSIIRIQRSKLDSIQDRMQRQNQFKTTSWHSRSDFSALSPGGSDLSSLADSILESTRINPVSSAPNHVVSCQRQARLRDHLSRRCVSRVKSTAPANLSASKLLSSNLTKRVRSPTIKPLPVSLPVNKASTPKIRPFSHAVPKSSQSIHVPCTGVLVSSGQTSASFTSDGKTRTLRAEPTSSILPGFRSRTCNEPAIRTVSPSAFLNQYTEEHEIEDYQNYSESSEEQASDEDSVEVVVNSGSDNLFSAEVSSKQTAFFTAGKGQVKSTDKANCSSLSTNLFGATKASGSPGFLFGQSNAAILKSDATAEMTPSFAPSLVAHASTPFAFKAAADSSTKQVGKMKMESVELTSEPTEISSKRPAETMKTHKRPIASSAAKGSAAVVPSSTVQKSPVIISDAVSPSAQPSVDISISTNKPKESPAKNKEIITILQHDSNASGGNIAQANPLTSETGERSIISASMTSKTNAKAAFTNATISQSEGIFPNTASAGQLASATVHSLNELLGSTASKGMTATTSSGEVFEAADGMPSSGVLFGAKTIIPSSGGLFGDKAAITGEVFSTSSTANTTAVISGGLFVVPTSAATSAALFGTTTTPTVMPGDAFGTTAPESGFGSNTISTNSGGLFGATSTTANSGVSPAFGTIPTVGPTLTTATASSGGLFGATVSTIETTGGLFGAKTSTTSSGGLFGVTVATTETTGGLFGAKTSTTSSGGLFGVTVATTETTGGLFGAKTSTTSSGGLFGATVATTEASGLFGAKTSTTSSGGLFGVTVATTEASGLFGAKTSTTSSGGLFGATVATTEASGGLFGAQTSMTSSGGLFAATTTTASSGEIFGAKSSTDSGLFGATTTSGSTVGLFGASANPGGLFASLATTTTTNSVGLFGATTSPASSGDIFGATGTNSTPGSVFGNTSPGSVFGQVSNNAFGSQPATTASSANVFGSQPVTTASSLFGQSTFGQASGGSVFGQSTAEVKADASSSMFGSSSGGIFGGLGGKPSAENASKNVFGTTQFGSGATQNSASLFGNATSPSVFGKSAAETSGEMSSFRAGFSGSGGSVGSAGFSVAPQSTTPGGFGNAPAFDTPPAFGGQSAFGGSPSFGSTGSAFGGAASQGTGFAGFATSDTSPTFGGLAQASSSAPSFDSMSGDQGAFGGGQAFGGAAPQGFGNANQTGSSPSFTSYRQ